MKIDSDILEYTVNIRELEMMFENFKNFDWTKFSIRLAAFSCCLLQLSSITVDYMKGETTSRITLITSRKTSIPDISLCFPLLNYLNVSAFENVYPNISVNYLIDEVSDHAARSREPRALLYSALGNLTLTKLGSLMKNHGDIITDAIPTQTRNEWPGSSVRGKSSDIICKSQRYIVEPRMCITLSCKRNNKPVYYDYHEILEPQYGGKMIHIELNPNLNNISTVYWVILTAPGHIVRDEGHPTYGLTVRLGKPFKLGLKYHTIMNVLLENYETNCRYYSRLGFDDRSHYFQSCLNNLSHQQFQGSFYGTPQSLEKPLENIWPGFRQYYYEFLDQNYSRRLSYQKLFQDIRSQCHQLANQVDCVNEIFFPSFHRIHRKVRKGFSIVLYAPTIPSEINRFFPKYYLMDYLIYVGSSLNFWFGLSLAGLFDRIVYHACGYLMELRSKNQVKVKNLGYGIRTRRIQLKPESLESTNYNHDFKHHKSNHQNYYTFSRSETPSRTIWKSEKRNKTNDSPNYMELNGDEYHGYNMKGYMLY